MTSLPARRMLLVHAHPDDETINNGATMAAYVAQGAHVTLVTCTRGEQGEVIPAELAHLAADRDDTLGAYRAGELAAAMAVLGVSDHRFLGEGAVRTDGTPVLYRDSGMTFDADGVIALPVDARPNAFALADLDEAAGYLRDVIDEVRPQVVITYEPGGGYGHPDHVRAHDVTMRAVQLAVEAGVDAPKVYWVVVPRTLALQAIEAMVASSDRDPQGEFLERLAGWRDRGLPSMFVPDEEVTSVVDGSAFLQRKSAALAEHRTQVSVDGAFFALSNGVGQPLVGIEFYRLVRGETAGERDEHGWETDLFA